MNTNQKGNIGELAVASAAAEKGYVVSFTFGDCPYDMIIDRNGSLSRVQVKYLTLKNGSITVRFSEPASKTYTGEYNEGNIDAIAVYESTTKTILWIPSTKSNETDTLTIRFDLPKNGQSKGITMSNEFVDW